MVLVNRWMVLFSALISITAQTAIPVFDSFDYEPRGRRDPFEEPVPDKPLIPGNYFGPQLPLQRYEVPDLKLVGVLWKVKNPKAVIRDKDGKSHIVGLYTKVGSNQGYIAAIRESEIVIVETVSQDGRLVSIPQIVRISRTSTK